MTESKPDKVLLIIFLLFVLALTLSYNLEYRRYIPYIFSDEAVYIMMAQSLAYDRDLLYERKDLERFYRSGYSNGPQGVFLTKRLDHPVNADISTDYDNRRIFFASFSARDQFLNTPEYFLKRAEEHGIELSNISSDSESSEEGEFRQKNCIVSDSIYYSKFLVYPVFVSIFVFIFGDKGFMLFNFILFFLIILMGYKYLKKYNTNQNALLYVLLFFLVSASAVYTLWITPEIFNMFMVTAGFFFFSRYIDRNRLLIILISTVCFAVAAASKIPSSIFMLSLGFFLLSKKRIKTIFLLILVFSTVFLSFYGIQYILTGNYNAYWGDRKTFYWNFPLQEEGYTNWDKGVRLSNEDYFEKSFYFSPRVTILNVFYYVFGRFTGIFPYFIFSLVSVFLFIFDSEKRHRIFIFLSIIICIMSYIIMAPDNYQGGGGAVGNRFFIGIFPAFLFIVRRIKSFMIPVLFGIIGLSFVGVILINPFAVSYTPYIHALSPAYRLLPVEYTLLNTLPTLINNHTMVMRKDDDIWYRIHQFDENSLSREYGCFWQKGNDKSEFAVRIMDEKRLEYGVLTIFNGYKINNIRLKLPSSKIKENLFPGESRKILFRLDKSYPYFQTRVYPFTFSSSQGFIPVFHGLNLGKLNTADLGFLYTFNFNDFEVAQALFLDNENAESKAYAERAFMKNPEDIAVQNLLLRIDQDADLDMDIQAGFAYFFKTYSESISPEPAPDTGATIIDYAYTDFETLISDLGISFPVNNLEASTELKNTDNILDLSCEKPFSVQTPRKILPKGKYRAIFEIIPFSDRKNLLFIMDANSRINTVYNSHMIQKGNDYNIYSLDLDLHLQDSVSFRLTSFETSGYYLNSITIIPLEPVEYFVNYLNRREIDSFEPSLKGIGMSAEMLNYKYLGSKYRLILEDYFSDFNKKPEKNYSCQSISNHFIDLEIYDVEAKDGTLLFKSSFCLKKQINHNVLLNIEIIEKHSFIKNMLRALRLKDKLFVISIPLSDKNIPSFLLPADYLIRNTYKLQIPDRFDSENYKIVFRIQQ